VGQLTVAPQPDGTEAYTLDDVWETAAGGAGS
jgi:hypothetical protein